MLVCHTACEMDAPEVVVSVLRETENDAPSIPTSSCI